MQINYRNALVLTLIFTLQCNGMDKTTRKARKQREIARAQARHYKQQTYGDLTTEYGSYESAAQQALKQREAKRNLKNKSPRPK